MVCTVCVCGVEGLEVVVRKSGDRSRPSHRE